MIMKIHKSKQNWPEPNEQYGPYPKCHEPIQQDKIN